ncbi:MAG: sulfite exporter TauE/SafE family protein [Burkholderiales bacterium]|nr:sulfite exporter TauE/SafE family protein [Burkholderiales bacterium]
MPFALAVGWLMGATGIGGILLIPAVILIAGVEVKVAMATMLATFLFTGVVGAALFRKRGSMSWNDVVPLCVPAAGLGFLGAWANSLADASLLGILLGALTVAAGLYAGYGPRPRASFSTRNRVATLAGIGATTGFVSGLTGVGGPVLSVPLMLIAGYSPLTAIGAGQALQVVSAFSGTAGNLAYGSIDYGLVALITVLEIAGVMMGVRFAHRASTVQLRRLVAVLCMLVGLLTMLLAASRW